MHAQILRNPTFADFPFAGGGNAPDGGVKFQCDEAVIDAQILKTAQRLGWPAPARLVEARRDLTTVREQLAEARQQLATIGENAQRTATAERQLAEARSENQRLRGVIAARAALDKTLAESGLPEVAWPRVTSTVIGADGAGIPLTEAGSVDDEKLGAAITAAIGTEKSYIAGLAEAAGTGVPRGLGATDDTALSEADLEKELAESFRGLGMSESAATVAAKGR